MGTRSLTYVYTDASSVIPLVCMYRQFDGYPSGHGAELAKFLNGMTLVNGLSFEDNRNLLANGMGCLAAQMVAHFKVGAGGFYLEPAQPGQDCGQEYEYHVYESRVVIIDYRENVIFDGSYHELLEFAQVNAVA